MMLSNCSGKWSATGGSEAGACMTFVDVGGYRLDADVLDGRSPPVVFVNGLATPKSTWADVLSKLGCGSQVVLYDRAATGGSEPRPQCSVSYGFLAAELLRLLDRLSVVQPAVFVGHSVGSLVVRMVAAYAPTKVAGMVHVDGSIPELAFTGPQRSRVDGSPWGGSEIDHTLGTLEVNAAVLPLEVPTVTLVKTPGRYPNTVFPDIDELWDRGQQQMADELGAFRVDAVDSGHFIQNDAPGLVALAVDSVVDAVRIGSRDVALDEEWVGAAGGLMPAVVG